MLVFPTPTSGGMGKNLMSSTESKFLFMVSEIRRAILFHSEKEKC